MTHTKRVIMLEMDHNSTDTHNVQICLLFAGIAQSLQPLIHRSGVH